MRNKTQSGRLARKAYLFLLPSLAGTAVFVLLPYVDVVRRSFFEAAGGRFVAMQNYVTVAGNSAFRLASFNTLRFLVICVPLLVLVSLFCSMLIAGLKEEGTVFKTSLLVPLAIPVASIVLLWKLFFHPQGMVNQITALFGMAGIDWIDRHHLAEQFFHGLLLKAVVCHGLHGFQLLSLPLSVVDRSVVFNLIFRHIAA